MPVDPDRLREWQRRSAEKAQKRAREKPRSEMKRTEMKRGTTKLRARNPKTAKRRKDADEVYGTYHRWVASLGCFLASHPDHVCGRPSPERAECEGHHARSVGAGGKDYANGVPVCPNLHDLVEGRLIGTTRRDVERLFEVSLRALAANLAPFYYSGQAPTPALLLRLARPLGK